MNDSSLVASVQERAQAIRERVAAAGADPDGVRLVAVTKGQPSPVLEAALAAGLSDLAESYVQELVAKVDQLADAGAPPADARWHLIGRLQRNKVRSAAPHVHLWQSVDRLSLAAEIANRAPGAAVLVQVNVSGAEQQAGCPPERTLAVVEGCVDLGLEVRGLMAIGPQGAPAVVRAGFARLRALVDQLGLAECSMGMSGDFELAAAEGSTMIRVGTALFGPRGEPAAVGK